MIHTLTRKALDLLSATLKVVFTVLGVVIQVVTAVMFLIGSSVLLVTSLELYTRDESMWMATATAAFCSVVLGLYYVVIRPMYSCIHCSR